MSGRWSGRHRPETARVSWLGHATRFSRANPAPAGHPHVGASIWQTPGGVQSELDQINAEFVAFGHEIFEVVTNLPGFPSSVEPARKPLADLFTNAWSPLMQAWQTFYADHKGWMDNLWWNHAPEAEAFLGKLVQIRESALQLGMRVMTPRPIQPAPSLLFDPEHNLFDAGAEAAKKATTDLWGVVKVAAFVGLGVGGLLLTSAVIDRMKGSGR